MIKEITETDIVLRIEPLHKCRFAYALMPGSSATMPPCLGGWRCAYDRVTSCGRCFFGVGGVLGAVSFCESGWYRGAIFYFVKNRKCTPKLFRNQSTFSILEKVCSK